MRRHIIYAGLGAALVVGAVVAITLSADSEEAPKESAGATPRTPDGKPDLNGIWGITDRQDNGGFTQTEDESGTVRLFPSRRCAPNQKGCRDNTNQANDGEFTGRTETNLPLYRPEHWDKVQFLDYDTNYSDPMFRCNPWGVPRVGLPTKIVQTPSEVIFLYAGSNQDHDYRIIYTDGRPHDPNAFPTFYGDSIGHWEGDTLVIDVVSRNDVTWLAPRGGYFHSFNLHVIERFRREGDVLHYDATVEDPDVLLEPWHLDPEQLKLNPSPKATIPEGLPCREYQSDLTVSRIRH